MDLYLIEIQAYQRRSHELDSTISTLRARNFVIQETLSQKQQAYKDLS
jgi:hypothetical protein